MSTLTPEQETQLQEVLAELRRLTPSALIFETARLRLPADPDEAAKTQFRKGYAGAIAAVKIMAYITMMRDANEARLRIGEQVRDAVRESRRLTIIDPIGSIIPAIKAPMMAGLQELEFHKFAIAINRIRVLLPIALKVAGFKLEKSDRDTLEEFEPLRHYYEHIEERLPGGKNQDEAVTETDNPWRITFQLPVDSSGRVSIKGNVIQVDSVGAQRVQDLVSRAWERISTSTINELEKFFRNNLDRMPHASQVDSGWDVKIGGALAQETTTHLDVHGHLWEEVNGLYVPVPLSDRSWIEHESSE
jgi:hypothetical protein